MIFAHTSKEKDLWRGWFKNGQSLELSRSRYGWDFGAGIHVHSNQDDRGSRLLCLKFWRYTAFIPLGIIDHPWPAFEGPQWSLYASYEFDLTLYWGLRRKSWKWPFHTIILSWDYESTDGWKDVRSTYEDENGEWVRRLNPVSETHPFTYVLRSGKVQKVNATITRERWIKGRHILSRLGWPSRTRYDIDIDFDGEVGERAGSWKGGTVGCSHEMLPGETPLETLRRMEREREFG